MPDQQMNDDDLACDPALERQPVLLARSHAAASGGSRLPDGTVRGRVRPTWQRCRGGAQTLIRIEQHELGPRVYVFGQRIHEFALGLALIALLASAVELRLVAMSDGVQVLALLGAWLVIKDWRDLVPRLRNTSLHSRLAIHRPPGSLRPRRPGLPMAVAVATLVVAAVNAASALTPNIAWRGRLLLDVEPIAGIPIFHEIALPLSVALGLTAVYLSRRRRRALHLAIALLVGLAVLNIVKGLDVEEAALDLGLAFGLYHGRAAFDVEHEPLVMRSLAIPLTVAMTALVVAGTVSVWVAGRTDPSIRLAARETGALLTWQPGPVPLDDPGAPYAVRILMVTALLAGSWALFRPRRPRAQTGSAERSRATALVREHGRDTLASFKLRDDLEYFFSSDHRAFLGYRIEGRVLLVAGDAVGPDDALPGLIAEARAFAEAHGLRVGVLGASTAAAKLWQRAGFRSLYLGDEAIVETRDFSLDGRAIRKVRQSVSRLVGSGYTATVEQLGELCAKEREQLEDVSERWRDGEPERGFAMSIGGLDDGPATDGVVVVARDEAGRVRAWIHFLPAYGRAAMSLSLMRRDPETPNGLTEFLVVRSIELLRERGIEEVSLNFAAFARPLRSPRGGLDRAFAKVLGFASRWFQIESLYRFNAKFFPRWEPRYLLYQGSTALPAIGLAALVAEGQLPRQLTALLRTGGATA
jgi:lysyl-tRNA synthetase class 2